MHQGYLVGAAALVVGAIAALIWLPARAKRPVEEIEAEYEAEHPAAPGTAPGETPTPVEVPGGSPLEPAYAPVEPPEA